MEFDLKNFPAEAIFLTKDFCEAEYGFAVALNFIGDKVSVKVPDAKDEKIFIDELGDYVKRLSIAERTRPIKEMIIGRALYGIVEKNN